MDTASSSQDFVWPGEPGFRGFPKHAPDDCIRYSIFVLHDSPRPSQNTRSLLNDVKKFCTELLKKQLKGYIWQKQSFNLEYKFDDDVLSLEGRTVFGESIADEWIIVYLLVEASKIFVSIWIRCTDSDGEFLLVEAANCLPPWLDPEVASNRVWINHGRLLIIPRPDLVESHSAQISLEEALSIITSDSRGLIHDTQIEAKAFDRIQRYPEHIAEHFHSALITIPRHLALVLGQLPASISNATEAFYLRDPISLGTRPANDGKTVSFSAADLVTISVKFTRVSYAQIKSQELLPPPVWQARLRETANEREHGQLVTGIKVTNGFEMLLEDPRRQDDKIVQIIKIILDDLDHEQDLLPSDEELAQLPKVDEDDKWLEIDYTAFDDELSGRGQRDTGTKGFGEKSTQDNLRAIVKRFEAFLEDENAGMDGAQVENEHETDNDDDDDDDGGSTDEEINAETEYRNIRRRAEETVIEDEYTQKELAEAFKYLMDLPNPASDVHMPLDPSREIRGPSADPSDEDNAIRDLMRNMEVELRNNGALPAQENAEYGSNSQYELAKNLLESFQGQAGSAGPVGNLINAMGLQLPRYEKSVDEDEV